MMIRNFTRLTSTSSGVTPLKSKTQTSSQALKRAFALNLKNLKLKKIDPFKICKDPTLNNQSFDYVIIGGGSGGVSSALEASKLGVNTLVFDFVEPSNHGSKWGVGGTCVNVGCIAKKLIHNAALLRESQNIAPFYGYDETQTKPDFSWTKMISNIHLKVKKTNYDLEGGLNGENVRYVNCMATYLDANTILYSPDVAQINHFVETGSILDESKVGRINTKYSAIAVGGRPNYIPESSCEGSHLAITSDDLFVRNQEPGRTLVVGSGYVGIECSSFLHKLGVPTTLTARSTMLKGFDTGVVAYLRDYIVNKFKLDVREEIVPRKISKLEDGTFDVELIDSEGTLVSTENYDTVLQAVSRHVVTDKLNIKRIGVETDPRTKKVLNYDPVTFSSNKDGIFAMGDALDGCPELTPIASMTGIHIARTVAHKLALLAEEPYPINFDVCPTTVFSYPEYSKVGMSEDDAIVTHGAENVEVWHSISTPTEESLNMDYFDDGSTRQIKSYFKLVCLKEEGSPVVGIHYVGLQAGEIMQGFALAFSKGVTKTDFDRLVGIHPTMAENFTSIIWTKEENANPEKTSC